MTYTGCLLTDLHPVSLYPDGGTTAQHQTRQGRASWWSSRFECQLWVLNLTWVSPVKCVWQAESETFTCAYTSWCGYLPKLPSFFLYKISCLCFPEQFFMLQWRESNTEVSNSDLWSLILTLTKLENRIHFSREGALSILSSISPTGSTPGRDL